MGQKGGGGLRELNPILDYFRDQAERGIPKPCRERVRNSFSLFVSYLILFVFFFASTMLRFEDLFSLPVYFGRASIVVRFVEYDLQREFLFLPSGMY
jgi:hypothetical protein